MPSPVKSAEGSLALNALTKQRKSKRSRVPSAVQSGGQDWPASEVQTPRPVVQRLYEEVGRALALTDVLERLASAALDPVPQSPDQLRTLINVELARWSQVIRDAHIKTE